MSKRISVMCENGLYSFFEVDESHMGPTVSVPESLLQYWRGVAEMNKVMQAQLQEYHAQVFTYLDWYKLARPGWIVMKHRNDPSLEMSLTHSGDVRVFRDGQEILSTKVPVNSIEEMMKAAVLCFSVQESV